MNTKRADLSAAGWFLMAVVLWELVFNRLASALGLYSNVGAMGFLSTLAQSGRFAMNATGIMALVLSCVFLPRLASAERFAPRPIRFVLMLASPLYLPILAVSIFRPVGQVLILFAYMIATGSAILIAVSIAIRQRRPGVKRIALILGLMEMLAAMDLLVRWFVLNRPAAEAQALVQDQLVDEPSLVTDRDVMEQGSRRHEEVFGLAVLMLPGHVAVWDAVGVAVNVVRVVREIV